MPKGKGRPDTARDKAEKKYDKARREDSKVSPNPDPKESIASAVTRAVVRAVKDTKGKEEKAKKELENTSDRVDSKRVYTRDFPSAKRLKNLEFREIGKNKSGGYTAK